MDYFDINTDIPDVDGFVHRSYEHGERLYYAEDMSKFVEVRYGGDGVLVTMETSSHQGEPNRLVDYPRLIIGQEDTVEAIETKCNYIRNSDQW